MKSLVLGGTGFVGMHLARELLQRGHDIVIAGASAGRSPGEIEEFFGKVVPAERVDLTVSYDVYDTFARVRPDKVFDASGYAPKAMSPAREIHLRTAAVLNVIEACRILNVGQLTLTSSSDIYWGLGAEYYPFNEARPISITEQRDHPYIQAAAKKHLETIASMFQRQTTMDIRIARIGAIYGPLYNKLINVVARMVHAGVRGQPMDLAPDNGQLPFGDQAGDFNYAKDQARGMAIVHDAVAPAHKVYNIGSGKVTRFDTIAAAVNRLYPHAIPELPANPKGPANEKRYLDTTRIRELGFEPKWSVEDGIADYARWLLSHKI